MTKIHPIGKYRDSNSSNLANLKPELRGTDLAFTLKKIISDESNPHYEVIIFANGNRIKDVSKDNLHTFKERDYTTKISHYFKGKGKNVLIEHILLDPDMPLDLDSRLFANYIDSLAKEENIDTINLIGHSKCGPVLFNMPKYLTSPESLEKTSIVTTASPFAGCLIATPTFFLKDVKIMIDAQLPKPINTLVYNALEKYYSNISSASHMDNDIALPGYTSDKYDPNFIRGLFDLENINAMRRIRSYKNFITGIDDETLIKSLKRRDFTSVGLCLLDRFFMKELTDGFIEVKSQEKVNDYFLNPSKTIESTTHYFLSHEDEMSIVLDYINNNIDEYKEKKEYEGRKKI